MENEGLPRDGILTCWKEIASYFHRDVRTVQRWEREQGLPVHRHPHQRRSSVYAYPRELESWWVQHQHQASATDPAAETPSGRAPSPPRWATWGAIICATAASAAGLFLHGSDGADPPGFPVVDVGLVKSTTPLDIRSLDDVNGDGRGDVVAHVILGKETMIYFGVAGASAGAEPDVRIVTAGPGHPSGGSVGDVDGDGLNDLVVNLFLAEPASFTATGPSYLVRGRRDWPAVLHLPQEADTEFYVDLRTDIRMGVCTTPGGIDLNGDGLRDVLLGGGDFSPPGRPSAGGAFVLFGRRQWPARLDVFAGADVTIHGSRTGDALRPTCSAGDFTADGRPDLALIATEDTLWRLQGGRGRTYIFAGSADWPRVIDAERDATLQLLGSSPGAVMSRPWLTDVNGDAVADLVVGSADPERRSTGGRVSVVFGGRDRRGSVQDVEADLLVKGGPTFGTSISTADTNLDGCSDLIVAEPGTGVIRLFPGKPSTGAADLNKTMPAIVLARAARGTATQGLESGDLDGDGAPDLAFEIPPGGAGGLRRLVRLTPALPIEVDVRPGVTPNVLVPEGVLAVEVSSASLALDLDATSFRLGGLAPSQVSWQDFDGNGRLDLRLYFDVSRLAVPAGATRVALRGRTRHGWPVSGADDIVVIPTTVPQARDK